MSKEGPVGPYQCKFKQMKVSGLILAAFLDQKQKSSFNTIPFNTIPNFIIIFSALLSLQSAQVRVNTISMGKRHIYFDSF